MGGVFVVASLHRISQETEDPSPLPVIEYPSAPKTKKKIESKEGPNNQIDRPS